MMIAYFPADIFCELDEYSVLTLSIENQHIFNSMISDIYGQINGKNGDFVLSENYQPLDMRKKAELITQMIPFEVNQRDLVNKLYSELRGNAVNEKNYQRTQELISYITKYIYTITEDEENELTADIPEDINGILKAFNVRFSEDNMDLSEKILEYITAVNKFKGEKVFFFVNLRSYLTDKQTELLFKSMTLKKMKVICIENIEHTRIPSEKTIIIDKDMCVI